MKSLKSGIVSLASFVAVLGSANASFAAYVDCKPIQVLVGPQGTNTTNIGSSVVCGQGTVGAIAGVVFYEMKGTTADRELFTSFANAALLSGKTLRLNVGAAAGNVCPVYGWELVK